VNQPFPSFTLIHPMEKETIEILKEDGLNLEPFLPGGDLITGGEED